MTPGCTHFGSCGGCAWQDHSLSSQLEAKRRLVELAFQAEGVDIAVPDPIPSPVAFGYRNRMEFTFSARRWLTSAEIDSGAAHDRDFTLGLHVPGGFDRVMEISECRIQPTLANDILRFVRAAARESGRPAWNKRTHAGFWRYLGIRVAANTQQCLIDIVTAEDAPAIVEGLAERIADEFSVTTITHGITNSVADTSMGARRRTILGPGTIDERIGDLVFRLGPTTFFQPNTHAAALLFDLIVRCAQASGSRVLDLFCGTGAIALCLARDAASVTGFEVNPDSVAAARANARLNGLANCEFMVRDLDTEPLDRGRSYDLAVVDPPRAGMHPRLVRVLAESRIPRIVSVGCNPSTQARDVAELGRRGGYRPIHCQPVDQFPHTPHVENVVVLELSQTNH